MSPTAKPDRNYWPYFVTALVALLVGGLPGWVIGIQAPSETDVQRMIVEQTDGIEQRIMSLEERVNVIEERQQNVLSVNSDQGAQIAAVEARIAALEVQVASNDARIDNLAEGGP